MNEISQTKMKNCPTRLTAVESIVGYCPSILLGLPNSTLVPICRPGSREKKKRKFSYLRKKHDEYRDQIEGRKTGANYSLSLPGKRESDDQIIYIPVCFSTSL